MKCPKCSYLGFETGDRCKNCGYDFSLMVQAAPDAGDIDLELRDPADDLAASQDWLAEAEAVGTFPEAEPAIQIEDPPAAEPEPAPSGPAPDLDAGPGLSVLSTVPETGGDEPLIRLPPTPRPPLAVRRTPDTPRLRAFAQSVRHVEPEPEPVLQFDEESATPDGPPLTPAPRPLPVSRVWAQPDRSRRGAAVDAEASRPGARIAAAAIDHGMLCGIDLAVIYFTLRMAGLSTGEWTLLPPVPLAAFLLLVKVSYFCAFTAVGGQTIGKMAARIRVVGDDDRPVDGALAIRRTLAGVASAALLGLGFLPALFGSERRALHDRLAHTRVVALPSA